MTIYNTKPKLWGNALRKASPRTMRDHICVSVSLAELGAGLTLAEWNGIYDRAAVNSGEQPLNAAESQDGEAESALP